MARLRCGTPTVPQTSDSVQRPTVYESDGVPGRPGQGEPAALSLETCIRHWRRRFFADTMFFAWFTAG